MSLDATKQFFNPLDLASRASGLNEKQEEGKKRIASTPESHFGRQSLCQNEGGGSDPESVRPDDEVRRPRRRRLEIFIKWAIVVTEVIYILLFVPRLFALVVFFGYFLKCATLEKATIANCTQEFLVSNPKIWVMCWKTISMISSFTLIFIIWWNREQLNYSFYKLLKLYKKASFWWMNALFVATFVYYLIRIDGSDIAMSIMLLCWWPATLLVVFSLNNLSPVWFPYRNYKDLHAVCFSLGYWITIMMYCVENFSMMLAVTIAALLNLTPLINGDHVEVFVIILLAIRVKFTTCLFSFFLDKFFHGNKDLFSEPSKELEKQKRDAKNQTDMLRLHDNADSEC